MHACHRNGTPPPEGRRRTIAEAHLADERTVVAGLLDAATFSAADRDRILARGRELIEAVRAGPNPLDNLLHEYDLSSQEGVLLMCLAEGLLRIPDAATADRLIHDKLGHGDWDRHLGHSPSLLVNASTWGLMLTGRFVDLDPGLEERPSGILGRLIARSGEPLVRQAVKQAMHVMARQFVMGRTIEEALERAGEAQNRRYRYSFDMLGEAAVCEEDAGRYFDAYAAAIDTLGEAVDPDGDPMAQPGISIKLSALHPRYHYSQPERIGTELTPRLLALARRAREVGVPVTIDAEEADRLEPSLDVLEAAFTDPDLADWPGLGLAVQAYQKRALPLIDWLDEVAERRGARIPVRLVKGAYWDTEIKRAQQQGLPGYPVFTRKVNTDLAYLACARRLLELGRRVYPQFASHNAHTVAAVAELAGDRRDFEFQRLHGMGAALFDRVVDEWDLPCRVYAPVGSHRELLPYLVRRLLENGANTSFVNRIVDADQPADALLADPAEQVRADPERAAPRLPLPAAIYGERRNSSGLAFDDPLALHGLCQGIETALAKAWRAAPRIAGERRSGDERPVTAPADRRVEVGRVAEADAGLAAEAMAAAAAGFPAWNATPVPERAACLERAADLLEEHREELMALVCREGGRALPDALAEVREAADFCRYYALLARQTLDARELPGPTGERNILSADGRGVFACASPWNFPVAIFTGQVAAALVAGNAVVAKPAHQTPLCAMRVVELLHQAGVPADALHFLPGASGELGEALLADPHLAGVAFTGSTATARHMARTLAAREGPIVPLVAETGGQNALIVDSSALPEQVIQDTVRSAFNSAGQRCSALRILFLQEEIADPMLELLAGAMDELAVGDPLDLATDCGPVIDTTARDTLQRHLERMEQEGRLIRRATLPEGTEHGTFLAPHAFEIDRLDRLPEEVFGPVLHVLRYRADELDAAINAINATGYGLTLGVHSRVEETARHIAARANCGNVYINRDIVGSVVGSQPFGGRGLSGTGPKAGGPDYLTRFIEEKVVTDNIAAVGGNAALLSQEYD